MKSLFGGKVIYSVDLANKVLSWQVNSDITINEAKEVISTLKNEASKMKGDIRLFVDNSNLKAVFKPEVADAWKEMQLWIFPMCNKIALICSNHLMRMQMNRISKDTNISDKQEAFFEKETKESYEKGLQFLGITKRSIDFIQ
ncbi:hypothetical protein ACFVS2_25415 [Brevibacillus sp. NPDC058079]|uniref:hypothetical protein n=1 Tax=Brevibacillus sp. NPDC058079 TaxID=3346330 RepID=UPI0036E5EA7B